MDAVRFVEVCRAAGVGIYGMEGFLVRGTKVQPLQEHSVDYYGQGNGNMRVVLRS